MEKDINKTKKDLKKPSSVKSVINTNPQLPGVVENGPAVAKTPLAEKILRLSGKVKLRNESTQFRMSQENVDLLIDAVLTENLDDKIEKLLRVGLGDINKISMYRKALSDPDAAVKTTVLRKYIVDVLDKLLDIIEDDNVLYQRLLANLMKRKSMKECAITVALKKKSEKFDYDFETLAEVYYRGVQSWDKTTGTAPVQFGFNRVNSFVNGGRASRLDEDLVVRDKGHTTSAGFKAQVRHEPGKPAKFVRRNTGEIKINETVSKNSLSQWNNEEPIKFVKSLASKLGKPSELTENRAVWYNKDGFKRIEVKDEYVLHCCPAPHYDFVYCVIDLHVPKKFVRILAESSESILLDLLKNEVTARCATLSANAVTLNYVLDVVSGRVQGSKEEYENRIKQLYKNKLIPDPDWWPDVTNEVRKQNKSGIKINEANPAIETDPKLKKKTVNREIYGVNRKTMDPMSEGNVDPKKRFIGTKSLTDTYKKDTPGEKLKETTTGGFSKKVNVADVPVRLIAGKIKKLPPAKSSSSKGGD